MKFIDALTHSSNQVNLWLILFIIIICTFFTALIPPFESPDENEHINRAYLLSQGIIILDAPAGQHDSGGMIDSGLTSYRNAFMSFPYSPDQPGKKLTAEEMNLAKKITWTGSKEFKSLPAMARYFPVIYLPQAIGLKLGEKLGLTINTSYYLARFFAITAIAIILFSAFTLYPVNPLTVALLIMPMSVFQYSSASLDGISSALAIFCIAAFLRLTTRNKDASTWLFCIFALSVVLVAASRVHLLPLLALLLTACFYTRNKKHFYIFAIALSAVTAWLVIATITTVGGTRLAAGNTMTSVTLYYIKQPFAFLRVLVATLSQHDYIISYRDSFFVPRRGSGTPFTQHAFLAMGVLTLLIGMLSFSAKNLKTEWLPRLMLLLSALVSILLIFFLLLIQWTPHPAEAIEGIQGRYFLVPMIMAAYAISGGLKPCEGVSRKAAFLLVLLLGEFYIFSTSKLLIDRFYLDHRPPILQLPSPVLSQHSPITLFMDKNQESNTQPLKRIGIRIGTYIRTNPGEAELKLTASDGSILTIPFNLSELVDNQYKFFDLDLKPYSSGQIVYLTGGGVSTWEAHDAKESVSTCIILEYANGKKVYTNGCSRF